MKVKNHFSQLLRVIWSNPRKTAVFIGLVALLAIGAHFTAHEWSQLSLAGRIGAPTGMSIGALVGIGGLFLFRRVSFRIQLHKSYVAKNGNKPLKVKLLKVKHLTSEEDLNNLKDNLRQWLDKANGIVAFYKEFLEKNQDLPKEDIEKLKDEYDRFKSSSGIVDSMISSLACMICKRVDLGDVRAIYDDQNVLQGVVLSTRDEEDLNACQITYLLSAPHNLVSSLPELDQKNRVEGAATALIAEVIFSHARPSLSDASTPLVEKRVIKLKSAKSALPFYTHVGFTQVGENTDCVLTGPKLTTFLNNYGGRALPA